MGLSRRLHHALTHTLSPRNALGLGVVAHELVMRNLRDIGFRPAFVLDIGAYRGKWTRSAKRIFPDAEFLLFEALAEKAPQIGKTLDGVAGWTLYSEVLGRADGLVVPFSVMETGSSYYDELTPYPRTVVERTTRSIDSLLADVALKGDIYVKMDTQGSELDILAGGRKLLETATFISIETSSLPYNRGAPSTAEVISFMTGHGFEIFDLLELHRRSYDGVLFQIDILFVNAASALHRRSRDFSKGI